MLDQIQAESPATPSVDRRATQAAAILTRTIRKTAEVAVLLDQSPLNLCALVRARRIKPPAKDLSGHFLWTDEDIAAARHALANPRNNHRRRQVAGGAA